MELRIKPFPKNTYPKKGLLIKGTSPLIWLQEMEALSIDLEQVKTFAVPSNEPNVLYGCFLVFQNLAPNVIGRNAYFQCIDNKLFIPENTTLYPQINAEDWQNADSEYLIMHPEFGLVKLSEQIDWISLLQEPGKSDVKIRKPLSGVKIPKKIESYTVEMDDQKILETLQKSRTEEEWMKNLPFDMKKVMAGNKKELEKYLKYIEKYPERAVELGVPLDIMGTSRGDGFGKFKFNDTWFGKFFGGGSSNGEGSKYSQNYRWIFWAVLIVFGLIRISYLRKDNSVKEVPMTSSGKVSKEPDSPPMIPVSAYQSGVTDIDMKIDSMYGAKRRQLMSEQIMANVMYHDLKKENLYAEYLKKGGKPIEQISKEINSVESKVHTSQDSLKKVYGKKIVKYLVQSEEKYKKKITDSLNKISSGIPADKGIVKNIWRKKQILIEDSLGRLYGTKDLPEPTTDTYKNPQMKTIDNYNSESYFKKKVSFSEIMGLIIFITGAVGLYSFIFRRKSMNMGGENVPFGVKVFLMLVLLAMLAYLFYPLIEMFGYNWFVWILVVCVALILYRLFSEDKNILKSDKDE